MSKRILSLVLALVMVLGTFGTVFAVDTTVEQDAAAFLAEAEVLLGDDEGNLNLDLKLERRDMVILLSRLMGEEEVASKFPVSEESPTWEDVRTDAYYVPFFAWAQVNEFFAGNSDKEFAPREAITAQDYAVVLLRALGYETEGHDAWTSALADAKALGILADVTVENANEITRGQMSVMTLNALAVNVKDSTKTLAETLEIVLPVPAVPAELEVVSVSANNLKTMVIEFNLEIDEDTLSNIEVDVDHTVELSEDGKTAVVIYDTAVAQSKEVKLTIDGLKSVDGKELAKLEEKYIVADLAIPVLENAKALNAKQIELKFSEPVDFNKSAFTTMNNVKVDGKNLVAKTSQNYITNTVVLTATTAFKAGEYKLEVSSIADFSKLVMAKQEFNLEFVEDTVAPKMIEGKAKSIKVVEVTFDEAIDRLSDGSYGTFKVNGTTITRSNVNEVANSAGTKFELTLVNELDLSAVVEVKVAYKGQKDMAANEVKDEQLFTFAVNDDTSLPEVLLAVGTGNKITLTFTKPMLTDVGTIKVLDKNKAEKASVTINSVVSKFEKNNSVLVLTGSDLNLTNTDVENFTLNIKGMKDATIRKNLLPEQNIEFTTKDTKLPSVLGEYTLKTGNKTDGTEDTITFYFSEAMNEDTLKNLSNYVNSTTSNPLSVISGVKNPVVSSDRKSVTITYKLARNLADAFTVYGVKDETGNLAPIKTGIVKAAVADLTIASAEATALNKIVVEFSKEITSVDPSVLKVEKGTSFSSEFVSATISSTNAKKVTFITAKDLEANTTGYSVVGVNKDLVSDLGGNNLVANATRVLTDKIAPKFDDLLAGNKVTSANDESANMFTVVFTEDVTIANILNEIVVRDADDVRIAQANLELVNGPGPASKAVIRVKDGALSAGSQQVKVTFPIVTTLLDLNSNELEEVTTAKTVNINVATVGVMGTAAEVTAGVAPEAGVKEVNTLTVTGTATSGGTIVVTLDGVQKPVALVALDDADAIAGKIATAFAADANYDVTVAANVVTFTAKLEANKVTVITLLDTVNPVEVTGVAASVTAGVAPEAGVKEVNTLTITGTAKVAGTLEVVLNNGTPVEVVVASGDTAEAIATKIAAAFVADVNYDVTALTNVVTFTAKTAAADVNVTITLAVK